MKKEVVAQSVEFNTGTKSESLLKQIIIKGARGFDYDIVNKLDEQFTNVKKLYEDKMITSRQYNTVTNLIITKLIQHIAEFCGVNLKKIVIEK